jgi:MscS family membrane protein
MHILFIFLFFVQNLFADPCLNARSSIQNFLVQLQNDNWKPQEAAACFEGINDPSKKDQSIQAAIQLKQVLDARGMFLNIEDYPNDPNFVDEQTKSSLVIIHPDAPQITIKKKSGSWIVPQSSFAVISALYQETFSSYSSQLINILPPWFQTPLLFHIQLWQILYFISLLLFSWLIGRIIDTILMNRLMKLAQRNKFELTSKKIALIRTPIIWMCFGLILMYGTPNLKLSVGLSRGILWICKFIITLSVVLLLSKLLNRITEIMISRATKTESKLDDQLIPLIRRTFQILLWTVGSIFLLQNYGVDVTSLITLGSLATVGIALASKDALENLFGSIVAFVDQPFQIGDWVIIDNSIEGVVEEVGFRSTRIRAFTNSLITVPNAKITRCTVNNFGKRDMRRFKCMIGLRYDTPVEKMELFLQEIRSTLEQRPSIINEAIFVYLNQMGSSSLDIMVYTFFKVPDWRTELAEKEQLLLEFMRVAQRVGVGFAFPTQTLEIDQFPHNIQ